MKTMNEKSKKRNTISSMGATFICLCMMMGSLLTGCSDKSTTSTGDTTVAESMEETMNTREVADDIAGEETNDAGNNANAGNGSTDTAAETSQLDENLTYYADIEIADYGKITVQLDQASAPITTANFVKLAESGFYNGLTFHRIMEGFMMQGGDPYGNGTGGSDENIVGEFAVNGYDNNLSHTRGAISMARSMDYNSASSQFFIVHADSLFLDGQYAVFGYVTEGLEVVDAVCETSEPIDGNGTIEAEAQPVITSITIRTE